MNGTFAAWLGSFHAREFRYSLESPGGESKTGIEFLLFSKVTRKSRIDLAQRCIVADRNALNP
jgi:hypothetical protein